MTSDDLAARAERILGPAFRFVVGIAIAMAAGWAIKPYIGDSPDHGAAYTIGALIACYLAADRQNFPWAFAWLTMAVLALAGMEKP